MNNREIFKYAGWLGLLLLAAWLLRTEVLQVSETLDKALLISGGILIAISLAMNFGAIMQFFGKRSSRLGANTAVMSLAVLAILGIINFFGFRHHKRLDLTSEQLYSLSDQTRKIVAGLKQDVKVIKIDKKDEGGLRDTMEEYRNISKRISYELIDPQQKLDIAQKYKVQSLGETLVVSGERTERLTEPSEQTLTNAILKVTREKLKTICFIEDHGERSVAASGGEGFSALAGGLKNENYETKTINLATGNVEGGCDVLILAGPQKPLSPPEATAIAKYLDDGGKTLMMLDPDTDPHNSGNAITAGAVSPVPVDLLKNWNIAVGNETVLEQNAMGQLAGLGPASPIVRPTTTHPITKDIRGATIFPFARPVKVADASKTEISTTELLKTSSSSWGETNIRNGEARFDEGTDQKGPISIGVAASKKIGEKEARLVIIGDSTFASNGTVGQAANADLILNTINWLAQDEDLISIRPKAPSNRSIELTEVQKNLLRLLTMIFIPALVIISGAMMWWKRR
jgi:ABC-type uncharacterized transport system involved in gliding motility auxiliary subunit